MMIPLSGLVTKHDLKIRGIFHIGAHKAEECVSYTDVTANVIWFEANPKLIPELKLKTEALGHRVVWTAITSFNGTVSLNIANNTQSSSILPLGTHKQHHPDVVYVEKTDVPAIRMSTWLNENRINTADFNFVNLDIQGSERLALEGFEENLAKIDYIYSEISISEVYEGCCLLHDFDKFLSRYGFVRYDTLITTCEWGDAFYKRI